MRFVWTLFRREVKSYFVSPLAYTATAVFLLIMGVLFYLGILAYEGARVRAAANPLAELPGAEQLVRNLLGADSTWALLIIVPVLAMRLLAWERSQHTAELLLTAPMTTFQLVLGKFFGVLFVWAVMLALSCWMPITLLVWGKADPAPMWTGYLGLFLYGAFMLAVALLASSLTENPILASFLALLFMAGVNVLGALAPKVPLIGDNLELFTPAGNLALLTGGVVDTQAVVFFVSTTWLLLFVTAQVVDSQRWR
ncbi:MAG: hypothetical protein D6718_01465 [Acidobacteria bacterium]|nr:MAG: hypothetical protein D6718_01465 [Acidobacteriota bacterium]